MARFYEAPQSAFSDFIYQPNMELQLALADKEVQLDATKKAFASQAEYDTRPTFTGWQEDLDKSVEGLNEKVESIVPKLIEDPENQNYTRQFKNLTNEARELYSSGDIGMMTRHYADYQNKVKNLDEMASKIKDPNERTMFTDAQKKWRKYVGNQVTDYKGRYKDLAYNDFVSPMDSQKFLDEIIDPEQMKQEVGRYLSGKMPQSEQESFLAKFPGIDHKYYSMKQNSEKYQSELIKAAARNNLMNNDAYRAMMQQNFFTFGEGSGTGDDRDTSAESFKKYMEEKVNLQADTFASKFTGTKYDQEMKIVDDKLAIKRDLAASKKASENPLSLTIVDSTQDAFTPKELMPAMETFLNTYPIYNDPEKRKKMSPAKIAEFERLQQTFSPVTKDLDIKDAQDIAKYIPLLKKVEAEGSIFDWNSDDNEEIYDAIAKDIRGINRFGDKVGEKTRMTYSTRQAGRGVQTKEGEKYDPITELFKKIPYLVGPGRKYPDFKDTKFSDLQDPIAKEIVQGEDFKDLADDDKELLYEVVKQKYNSLRSADRLFKGLTEESGDMVKDIQSNATVNVPYLAVGAQTPLADKTAAFISKLKGLNKASVYDSRTTSKDYKGEYRAEGAMEENQDPIATLEKKYGTSDFNELINKGLVNVKIRPAGKNDIELVFSSLTGDPDSADFESTKLVYKNVASDYWADLLPHAKGPDQEDFIRQAMDPTYQTLSEKVNKTFSALNSGKSPLESIPEAALSNQFDNKITISNGFQEASDQYKKYTITWTNKDTGIATTKSNLSQAEVRTYLYGADRFKSSLIKRTTK